MFTGLLQSLEPVKVPPLHEWVEENLGLPPETSAVPGKFSMYYTPHLFGIFRAFDDPEVKEVVCMKAAQVAWTTAIIAYLLREVDCRPGPFIGMFSSEKQASKFSAEKLITTVQVTPPVRSKMQIEKRSSGNALYKKFPGGFLKLIGSNSIGDVKSTSARIVIVEEPDDSTENLKEQGDSVNLLYERTKRQPKSKRVLGGTPKVAGLSRVEKHLESSDKCVLPIVCHECHESHVLNYDHVVIPEGEEIHKVYGKKLPNEAFYCCPKCGSPWDDSRRKDNIRETVYSALESGDEYGGWVSTEPFDRVKGFHELSELYCCLPGQKLADLVIDQLKADYAASQGDENERIVFINSKLGRPYSFDSGALEADNLREFSTDSYRELEPPRGVLMVTVGIDVQHDRVAIIIKGWGRGEEHWTLYWGEIPASHTMVDKNDKAWQALEQLVYAPLKHESGVSLYAEAVSIDSSDGNTNDAVYSWVRSMQKKHRKVQTMAIKGSSATTDPEIFVMPRPSHSVDHRNPKRQTKADKYGLKPYIVGTNKSKNWLEGELRLLVKGLGKFHIYKGIRDDYWDQMCGEVKAPHRSIKNRLIWQQRPGRPIEAKDCERYALHAARGLRIHLLTPAQWDLRESKLTQSDMFSAPVDQPKNESDPVIENVPANKIRVTASKPANSSALEDIARQLNG